MELEVEKLVYGGEGLARLPADERGRRKAVFLPFVLGGERVEATLDRQKSEFARGRVQRILAASPYRIEPKCPYFQRCGGCHYQHTTYAHQLEIKTAILKESLARLAKIELQQEPQVHASPPWNYRNRTRMRIRPAPFALGYNRMGSHVLLPVEECPISSPLINRAIAAVWTVGRSGSVDESIEEIELFANAEDEQLQLALYVAGEREQASKAGQSFMERLRAAVPEIVSFAVFGRSTQPTGGKRTVESPLWSAGADEFFYNTRHAKYRVSPGAFFQINRFLTDELVDLVTNNRSGGSAIDFYAGVGLFSLPLAKTFNRVIAVESSPTSFADLRYNAPENVKPVVATTEQYLQNILGRSAKGEEARPDLVVVDPPRTGLGQEVARTLASLGTAQITYVSCDPATLARDLRVLLESGYNLEQVHLVDLFPQTFHIETVVQLIR